MLYRAKQGFAVHLEAFVGEEFWPYFRIMLHEGAARDYFDIAAIERLVHRLRTGQLATTARIQLMYQIWILAMFLHWQRRVLAG